MNFEDECSCSNLQLCPKCNTPTLEQGFGLAGGYGSCEFCTNDGCDYLKKEQEQEEL